MTGLFAGRLFPFVPRHVLLRWQLPDGSVFLGSPRPGGMWLPLEALATDAGIDAALRVRKSGSRPTAFVGNWVFQNLTTLPLMTAGFLFVAQNRVPELASNVVLDNETLFQNMQLLEERFVVLRGDPLSKSELIRRIDGPEHLSEALRNAVETAYRPIVDAFQRRRLVSRANAWASVLDSLHQGFLLAGRAMIGMDACWEAWESLMHIWRPATRRRPRRLRFEHRGDSEELTIHAACCLVFTTGGAGWDAPHYCAACPVRIPDDTRISRTAGWIDRLS